MSKIKAIRNNAQFEKQCENIQQWTLEATQLLDQGFMVLVDETDGLFSVLNSKDEVVFITDVTLAREKFSC